ncbi:hypothetical protein CRYUN_Cryun07bG0088700 [Craigia yunnanensis]
MGRGNDEVHSKRGWNGYFPFSGKLTTIKNLKLVFYNAWACLVGDSAAYQRTNVFGDDVVIVAAYRTTLCKSKRSSFKDIYPNDLLAPVLRALIEKMNLNLSKAIADVATTIKAGFYDFGIGAGLESMTNNLMAWEGLVNLRAKSNIRLQLNLTGKQLLLQHLKICGSTTIENSSQVSDGTGVVLLMKRSVTIRKRLPILGVFRTFTVVGVDLAIMGVSLAVTILAVVKVASLKLNDVDLLKINEAFASQFVYCCKKLELDPKRFNVNGGAMAIGHSLGVTGVHYVVTLLHEMK